LAIAFLDALTGSPDPRGLPRPFLFYVLDPLTCVLDLSLWHDFMEACVTLCTSGDGDVGNVRGRLFEEQVHDTLVRSMRLADTEIPWTPNRDVFEGDVNRGDVDFCFVRHGVLFNLDMKS
jgi:hypothetical protein